MKITTVKYFRYFSKKYMSFCLTKYHEDFICYLAIFILFYYFYMVRLLLGSTISDKSLVTPCNICHDQGIYQFVPFPPVQCCLSRRSCHCLFTTLLGWKGLPILVMSSGLSPKYLVSAFSCNLIQMCQGLLSWIADNI